MRGAIHRLFVALYPPPEASAGALQSVQRLGSLPPHREMPIHQVHMTLQFVGDTPGRDLPAVRESVRRSGAGVPCFDIKPLRLVTLPRHGGPRLIALQTDAPGPLLEIQQRLVRRLARRVRGDSRFMPHLTLVRLDNRATCMNVEVPVELPAFEVCSIVLMESILRASGAEHVGVEEVGLEPRRLL